MVLFFCIVKLTKLTDHGKQGKITHIAMKIILTEKIWGLKIFRLVSETQNAMVAE